MSASSALPGPRDQVPEPEPRFAINTLQRPWHAPINSEMEGPCHTPRSSAQFIRSRLKTSTKNQRLGQTPQLSQESSYVFFFCFSMFGFQILTMSLGKMPYVPKLLTFVFLGVLASSNASTILYQRDPSQETPCTTTYTYGCSPSKCCRK